MSYTLFLDDERWPSAAMYASTPNLLVVRSVEDAKLNIELRGWPEHVCFDHDLGYQQPTGMDFAKWLVDQDMETPWMDDFTFSVHSQNPVGAKNITALLMQYLEVREPSSMPPPSATVKITHVAVYYDGRVWSLPAPNRHHHVIRDIAKANGVGVKGPDRQGFLTEHGQFLNRRQAYELASANGQLRRPPDPSKYQGNELYSEDLW